MRTHTRNRSFGLVLALAIVIGGCTSTAAPATPPVTPTSPPAAATTAPPTAAPTAIPVPPTATPEPPTATPTPNALPPEPVPIDFEAEDGQELHGLYYPAAVENAALVVLMHWVAADQRDWTEIAFWLQNRGLGGQSQKTRPWLDPSWFPPMLEGQSFAVFTFSFRGCGEDGCDDWLPGEWLLDAQAAMNAASQLDGIDPQRVVSIGASIGADGAAHGCAFLNAEDGAGQCRGTLSLSPGNYLIAPYAAAVKPLQAEQPPKPVWCFYAEGDRESAPTCKAESGDAFRAVEFPGDSHGMMLVRPEVEPKTLELMLDFFKTALGL